MNRMSSRNAQCAPLQTTKVKVREDDLPTENRALRLTPPVIVDGDGDGIGSKFRHIFKL